MKMTKEIEEFLNLAITEHMGKAYTDWKLKQQTDAATDKVEEEYERVIASLSLEQEEAIAKYCDAIFSNGADTEEFPFHSNIFNFCCQNMRTTEYQIIYPPHGFLFHFTSKMSC